MKIKLLVLILSAITSLTVSAQTCPPVDTLCAKYPLTRYKSSNPKKDSIGLALSFTDSLAAITKAVNDRLQALETQPAANAGVKTRPINTTTYTLTAADNGYVLTFTASGGCTVSVNQVFSNYRVTLLRKSGDVVLTGSFSTYTVSGRPYKRLQTQYSEAYVVGDGVSNTLTGQLKP